MITCLGGKRTGFLGRLALLAMCWVTLRLPAADAAGSAWVYTGPDGKLTYKTTPAGDRIMDFSSAGYAGGGVALPVVPVKVTVSPSGTEDETTHIQAALDKVAALPLENGFRGAVLLASGNFPCAHTLVIPASGVILRGSGSSAGDQCSTIQMFGGRHVAIAVHGAVAGRRRSADSLPTGTFQTMVADAYVPAGAASFQLRDASGLAVGDWIGIQRPITTAWVKFMHMDDLTRDGEPQTWQFLCPIPMTLIT